MAVIMYLLYTSNTVLCVLNLNVSYFMFDCFTLLIIFFVLNVAFFMFDCFTSSSEFRDIFFYKLLYNLFFMIWGHKYIFQMFVLIPQ